MSATVRSDTPPAEGVGSGRAAGLLIVSGAAALIYQVLWIKQLTLIVGIDVHAVTIGVSSFFAGLALGGWVIGHHVDRSPRPLRLYALLEIGVAAIGVVTTLALAHAARLFTALEAVSGLLGWSLIFGLVGLAPFLMGGTLPAIVRSLRLAGDRLGSGGGRMYAANTVGAIAGALLSSFWFIPQFGIRGSALVAGGIGLAAAAAAFRFDRRMPELEPIRRVTESTPLSKQATVAILLYAVAGGLALGYEVVWSQSAVQLMSTRSFAFSVMLATYLTGLALGAALHARWADRVRDPWSVFGLLISSAGAMAMLEISLLGRWLPELQASAAQLALTLTDSRMLGMCVRFAIASAYMVLLPTMLLGAAFPAALRLIVDAGHVGRDVGRVVSLNTLGGILGTLITGFVLVPRLGLVRSVAVLAVSAALLGMLAARRGRRATIAVAFVTVTAAVLTPSDRLTNLYFGSRGGTMIFYEEGQGGTVAVLEQSAASKRFRRLYIQGVSNSGDAMPSLRYMRLQSLLPLIIHRGDPQSALVIGLGTGITAGALLRYPGLEQRVVAELLPGVARAVEHFEGNFDAATDPRLEIRLRDGRRELLGNQQRYDLITLEPPPPSAAGVVNLYSTDFYKLAGERLRPEGLMAQWLPLPTQNDEDTRSLVRSFLDAYPFASLWTTELHEMLLVGSHAPIELDVARIVERIEQPEVASTLKEVGVESAQALVATWVTDRAGLERYAGDALAVTDDRPRIEYADWVRHDELQRVLPRLIELRTEPPLRNASAAFLQDVEAERQELLLFYQAALSGLANHRELWARDMQSVLRADGDNAYYRWFGPQRP